MSKFVKTIWAHKKKALFLAAAGYYGLDYLYDRHRAFIMVRAFCQESLDQGRRPLPLVAKNKHITLLLNPVSSNRKARWRFEKYSEPMLHLAGFLVNVVKTERISEARDLTELIERTNVIAVAGGDGTLFETITGLLRREDADEATKRYPIGLIPVGIRNKFAKRLVGKEYATDQELIAESTMAIVRHRIKPQDVLQIELVNPVDISEIEDREPLVDGKEKNEMRKPVFSMSGITLGQFREADHIQTNMPAFLGEKFSTFWSLVRAPRPHFKAEIKYTPPCSGCTKCVKELVPQKEPSLLTRMSSMLRPARAIPQPKIMPDNPECGTWNSICVDTVEFNVKPIGGGCLEVEIGHDNGRIEFIREGLRRQKGQQALLRSTFQCSQIEILPVSAPDSCSIDYEEFELRPLQVKVLRDKVYFFIP